MARGLLVCGLLIAFASVAFADCYLQHPRGSNNRYSGDANNQNRLFDSQNNANGGYGWGPQMTYYEGSLLQVEWTSQHGCGPQNMNTDCEIILQYMCGPWIRDGTTAGDAQPPANLLSLPPATQLNYGLHEPVSFYTDCATRYRNTGLFLADQNRGSQSVSTRQDDNNRRGFECQEERDYYPYWHPSPWIDIAVLTSGPLSTRCPYYWAESQNVKEKGQCLSGHIDPPPTYDLTNAAVIPTIWGNSSNYNNPQECSASGNTWVFVPAWPNQSPPDCIAAPNSRDNHLGNIDYGAMTARYLWVIPHPPYWDDASQPDANKKATCVLRIRYNISSSDYLGWANVDGTGQMVDSGFNGIASPVKTNPTVMYGYDDQMNYWNLSLALNTAQYGRTFQDRSHSFWIKPRPSGVVGSARIFNLNVRGKRGNIVQTYPSTEYDFVPNSLKISCGDYVHFQWTGSDTNPAGNAGEGTDQTDRSNVVQLSNGDSSDRRKNVPMPITSQTMFPQSATAFRLAHLDQPPICNTTTQTDCCLTKDQLYQIHGQDTNGINQDPQNCAKLNAASPYFNGGLVAMTNCGTFQYMSTRNNNFTNRSQKATLSSVTKLPAFAMTAVVTGSAGFCGAAVVAFGVYWAKTNSGSSLANVFSGVKV